MSSLTLRYIHTRLKSVIEVLAYCESLEFPSTAGALVELVKQRIEAKIIQIGRLREDDLPEDIDRLHAAAGLDLEKLTPLLDYAVRSAESRNPHEFRGPLARLVRQALGEDIKLVVFAQWYPFPLVYKYAEPFGTEQFLLVGFPVHEAENPLIYPLAGHEIGHVLWRSARDVFQAKLRSEVISLLRTEFASQCQSAWGFDPQTIEDDLFWEQQPYGTVVEHAQRQCEEIFCDLIGLHVFGEAYLNAFHYSVAGHQMTSLLYPTYKERAEVLSAAHDSIYGKRWSFPKFPGRRQSVSDAYARLTIDLTDSAVGRMRDSLILEAAQVCAGKSLGAWRADPAALEEEVDSAVAQIKAGVPVLRAHSLQVILIAAWRCAIGDLKNGDESRMSLVREAALKSLEVIEIQSLLSETEAP